MRRISLIVILSVACTFISCHRHGSDSEDSDHAMPDTLRVATLYSPTSYFIYRDMTMGYDYGLVETLAQEKDIVIDLCVASSLSDAMDMLEQGSVDLVAYEVPITSEYKEKALHCGPINVTSQVLVQPNKTGKITDVTGLVDRDVYVEAGTKYQQRIEHLNTELGGGIRIHPVERDTLITEDMIEMVSKGEIPLTIVDSDIARINKTYYPDLDITLEVGFPQRSAWAVNKDAKWLADSIDAWIRTEKPRQENALLMKKYFELSKVGPDLSNFKLDMRGGVVSPYDALFRKYGEKYNIDWRLLAAVAYAESGFNNDATSWAGARGLMQIMPSSARAYGSSPEALVDPETSIDVACRIFSDLSRSLSSRVNNSDERQRFVLAAYNAGLGHLFDAIEIARNTGRNPQVWFGSVDEAMSLKSKPEYYNQPYCRNGYLRGGQTIQYVQKVLDIYQMIKGANIK